MTTQLQTNPSLLVAAATQSLVEKARVEATTGLSICHKAGVFDALNGKTIPQAYAVSIGGRTAGLLVDFQDGTWFFTPSNGDTPTTNPMLAGLIEAAARAWEAGHSLGVEDTAIIAAWAAEANARAGQRLMAFA